MSKYHLNVNNEPAECHASVRSCPRSAESPHFKTMEEAIAFAEEKAEKEVAAQDLFQTQQKIIREVEKEIAQGNNNKDEFEKIVVLPHSSDKFKPTRSNNLNDAVKVALLVKKGADTQQGVTDNAGVGKSTGGFMTHTAGYLGLIDYNVNGNTHELFVTPLGEKVLSMEPKEQHKAIQELASQTTFGQDLKNHGVMGAAKRLFDTASPSPAELNIASSWAEQIDKNILKESHGKDNYVPREDTHMIKPARQCIGCFIQLPVASVEDYCEDCI